MLCLSSLIVTAGHTATVPDTLLFEPGQLGVAVAAEAFSGALLGLSVHVALAAFSIAGRLLDIQIGFGIGSIFDPVTRASSNAITSLFSLLGVTLFVVSGAHVELASMLATSFSVFPLGKFPQLNDPLRMVTAAGAMFTFGVVLATPVALALLFTDLVVGVISRNSPQMNALLLTIPVKVIIGLAVLALSIGTWQPAVKQLFSLSTDLLGSPQ
jgi:flagellar biosynthetic protein FliR